MEFTGLTSASHMSLPEAGYGSEEGYVGSEISGAVSGVTTPGASRLQASQLQQRSTTMQRLHTQRIRAITRVQAAPLGEGVRDFLFDAFLHVARQDRPPRATPDGESPPPTGDRIWVPPIDWGRNLVGHPVPEREDTQGRTRYRDTDMAHPSPSATPSSTQEWERETWVARMASLSNFRHHIPGDIATPDNQQPAPSTYMTPMYNLHYTLSTTHYHAPTGHWMVHGTDSLLPTDYAPPPTQPRPRNVHQGGRAGRLSHLGHVGTQVPGHAALHPQRETGPW